MRELWATWYGRPYKAVHGRTVRTKYTRPEVTFTLRVNQLELLYLKAELDPDVERIRRSVSNSLAGAGKVKAYSKMPYTCGDSHWKDSNATLAGY